MSAKEKDAELARIKAWAIKAKEALTSIASQHEPRHTEENYWMETSHVDCAETLANDTRIAREALAEFPEEK